MRKDHRRRQTFSLPRSRRWVSWPPAAARPAPPKQSTSSPAKSSTSARPQGREGRGAPAPRRTPWRRHPSRSFRTPPAKTLTVKGARSPTWTFTRLQAPRPGEGSKEHRPSTSSLRTTGAKVTVKVHRFTTERSRPSSVRLAAAHRGPKAPFEVQVVPGLPIPCHRESPHMRSGCLADLKGADGFRPTRNTVVGGYGAPAALRPSLARSTSLAAGPCPAPETQRTCPASRWATLGPRSWPAPATTWPSPVTASSRARRSPSSCLLSSTIAARPAWGRSSAPRAGHGRVGFRRPSRRPKLPDLFVDHSDFIVYGEPEGGDPAPWPRGEAHARPSCTAAKLADLDALALPPLGPARGLSLRRSSWGFLDPPPWGGLPRCWPAAAVRSSVPTARTANPGRLPPRGRWEASWPSWRLLWRGCGRTPS